MVEKDGKICLRINIGRRDYVYVPINAGYKKGQIRDELLKELVEIDYLIQ